MLKGDPPPLRAEAESCSPRPPQSRGGTSETSSSGASVWLQGSLNSRGQPVDDLTRRLGVTNSEPLTDCVCRWRLKRRNLAAAADIELRQVDAAHGRVGLSESHQWATQVAEEGWSVMSTFHSRFSSVATLALVALAGTAAAQTSRSAVLNTFEVTTAAGHADSAQRLSVAAPLEQDGRQPRSADDHRELATLYRALGDQRRAEADALRQALVAELRRTAQVPNKWGTDFPWVARLKQNAQPAIDQAERASADAHRLAEYHTHRAKEVEGREFETLAEVVSRTRR